MKFFTKEWYNLGQQLSYTTGLTKIPDKVYSDEEINEFYEKRIQEEIDSEKEIYNLAPDFDYYEEVLKKEFDPSDWLIEDEETGEVKYLESREEAVEWFEKYKESELEIFEERPPFDENEARKYIERIFETGLKYLNLSFPEWVLEKTDHRLLAVGLMPENVFKVLKKEEEKNNRKYETIMKKAEMELSNQNIPDELILLFDFHDANVLSLKKVKSNIEMILREDGSESYLRVYFKNAKFLEREKGLRINVKKEDGELRSSCYYLYDELYRNDDGYEVHMMLWTMKGLRYVTVKCDDIFFEDDIQFV